MNFKLAYWGTNLKVLEFDKSELLGKSLEDIEVTDQNIEKFKELDIRLIFLPETIENQESYQKWQQLGMAPQVDFEDHSISEEDFGNLSYEKSLNLLVRWQSAEGAVFFVWHP